MAIISALPYNLTNGTTADATQVMANFNQIVSNTNSNAAHSGANSDITSLSALSTPLSVGQGGTGSATASGARTALGLGTSAVENLSAIIGDNGSGALTILAGQIIGSMLSSSLALPDGNTATTQSPGDNSTKVATTAYADAISALDLKKASNLSDLGSVATALTNLGFASTFNSTEGTISIPFESNKLTLKWKTNLTAGTNWQVGATWTFANAFSTAIVFAAYIPLSIPNDPSTPYVDSSSTSSVTFKSRNSSDTFTAWAIAIGY